MFRIIAAGMLCFVTSSVFCQQLTLNDFEKKRIEIDKKGMLALGAWGTVNIISGAIGTGAKTDETKYFHQMNMIWGASNLLLAGLGYWGATKENTNDVTLTKVLHHQSTKEKTFLINGGLDVAYIMTGLYLNERGKRKTSAKLKGYGSAVSLQGGFLLLFDFIMYSTHNKHGKQLDEFTNKFTLISTPTGIGMCYRL